MKIQPIVEGDGEVSAVPILLRRLRDEAQAWGMEIAKPHRRPRSWLVNRDTFHAAQARPEVWPPEDWSRR